MSKTKNFRTENAFFIHSFRYEKKATDRLKSIVHVCGATVVEKAVAAAAVAIAINLLAPA